MSGFQFPAHWLTLPLGEICSILDSQRIPINSTERNQRIAGKSNAELFPYYGATGKVGQIDGFLFDGEFVLVGEDGAPFMEPNKGVSYIVRGKFWVNNHAHILEHPTSNEFLCYYLRQIDYSTFVTGTTRLKLNQAELRRIPLPLPPPDEQKRIVAKIEELFSELDAGEENLRKARRQLGVYRQSLLKQAFEGKLTVCGKMKIFPLRSLITNLGQGWSPKCELNRRPEPDEWAIIKTTAIQHCRYDDSEAKPLPPPFKPRPAIEIRDGDFLMTRKGPRTRAGVSCYVRHTRKRLMICDTVYRFRCVEEKVYPLYLELALNSPDILHAIDELKAGISESGLSLTHTKIGTVEIPLCSLPEQQEIVRLLDEQFTVIEQNEREIDTALKRSEALRQSNLKKAFSGQLVPQDPTDEPAAVLLERIGKEREAVRKSSTKTLTRLRTANP